MKIYGVRVRNTSYLFINKYDLESYLFYTKDPNNLFEKAKKQEIKVKDCSRTITDLFNFIKNKNDFCTDFLLFSIYGEKGVELCKEAILDFINFDISKVDIEFFH